MSTVQDLSPAQLDHRSSRYRSGEDEERDTDGNSWHILVYLRTKISVRDDLEDKGTGQSTRVLDSQISSVPISTLGWNLSVINIPSQFLLPDLAPHSEDFFRCYSAI